MTATTYKPCGYGYGAQDAAHFNDVDKAERLLFKTERVLEDIWHDDERIEEGMSEASVDTPSWDGSSWQKRWEAAQGEFLRSRKGTQEREKASDAVHALMHEAVVRLAEVDARVEAE